MTHKNIVVGCVAGNHNNFGEIGISKDVDMATGIMTAHVPFAAMIPDPSFVGVGGGILDWEDVYGVIESYPSLTGASPLGVASGLVQATVVVASSQM